MVPSLAEFVLFMHWIWRKKNQFSHLTWCYFEDCSIYLNLHWQHALLHWLQQTDHSVIILKKKKSKVSNARCMFLFLNGYWCCFNIHACTVPWRIPRCKPCPPLSALQCGCRPLTPALFSPSVPLCRDSFPTPLPTYHAPKHLHRCSQKCRSKESYSQYLL